MSDKSPIKLEGEKLPEVVDVAPTQEAQVEKLWECETIEFHGRTIEILMMEHEREVTSEDYKKDVFEGTVDSLRQGYLPGIALGEIGIPLVLEMGKGSKGGRLLKDWSSILDAHIRDSSIVFLEYFPEELNRTAHKEPIANIKSRSYAAGSINYYFGMAAAIAGEHGVEVAVADQANTALWYLYEDIDYLRTRSKGIDYRGHGTEMSAKEIEVRTATDARRLITAMGAMEEAMRRKEGSKITIIYPPAHGKRIAEYIRRELQSPGIDSEKVDFYLQRKGLPKTTRIYKSPRSKTEHQLERALIEQQEFDKNHHLDDNLRYTKVIARALANQLAEEKELEEKRGQPVHSDSQNSHRTASTTEEINQLQAALEPFSSTEKTAFKFIGRHSWTRTSDMKITPQVKY